MVLIVNILRNISGMLVTAPMIFIIAILAIFLYRKNKKIIYMQKLICGGSVDSCMELTLSQLVLGIIGGCAGSIILGASGVIFENSYTIGLIFLTSIILFKLKPRFICFSYSAAVIGLIGLTIKILDVSGFYLGNLQYFKVNIMSIIMFVGVMHIIEGLLVMIDGYKGAVPIFAESNGKIFGGYSLKRYWIAPIVTIAAASTNSSLINTVIIQDFPKWWTNLEYIDWSLIGASVGLVLSNFYGVIGYSSVTFTQSKRKKAFLSGICIIIFGILISAVSQLCRFGIWAELIVTILTPISHEFMLKIQHKFEQTGEPKFVSNAEGLSILEKAEDSIFNKYGIDVGSRIVSVNNQKVTSEQDIYSVIKENLYNAVVNIIDTKGVVKQIKFRHKKNSRLGIVVVPQTVKKEDVVKVESDSFKNVLEVIKKKHNKI